MIIKIYTCRICKSANIVKNGTNKCGNPQYHCVDCGTFGVLEPKERYPKDEKNKILDGYQERASMRGVERIFGICRQTLAKWLKEEYAINSTLSDTITPIGDNEKATLELDELWSFIYSKENKSWVWVALCRETCEVVGYAVGDRSEKTCWNLWNSISSDYRTSTCYSDFWQAYQNVIPDEQHYPVGKDTGETSHIERFNNTIRQHLARFVRKILSFSKCFKMHEICLVLFLRRYNLELTPSTI